MPIPQNKSELLEAIKSNYSKLRYDLINISEKEATMVELKGHAKDTKMSVHNLVAYLVGWGELVLKWKKQKSQGRHVDFPETGFKWNQLGLLSQKFYVDYADSNYAELLGQLDRTVDDIVSLIESASNKQLYETTWYEKYTLGRMIQLNTSSPFKNARTRVRKWKREKIL